MLPPKVGVQIFFLVRKLQIRKFLGWFRYGDFANFLGVQVRKLQIRYSFDKNRKSLIRKFLQCATPLIANPLIFHQRTIF